MNKKRDIKFDQLFFFFFKAKLEDVENCRIDDIDGYIRICSKKAYLDMCRTLRFKKKEGKNVEKDELIKKIEDNIVNNVVGYLYGTVSYSSIPDDLNMIVGDNNFDKWHYCLSYQMVEECKNSDIFMENKSFTYGHAQKWINMTLKYMYIIGLLPEKMLNDIHVPIDSYIIDAINAPEKNIHTSFDVEGLGIKTNIGAWSGITDYGEYIDVQVKVRNKLKEKSALPIMWESLAWMAEAVK